MINAKTGDPASTLIKETGGGAHGVLITAPSLGTFKQGVAMTRNRGTCVLVGLTPGEFPVPLFDVVANCITIRGSLVGTRQHMAEALAFAVDGKVKADVEIQSTRSGKVRSLSTAPTADANRMIQKDFNLVPGGGLELLYHIDAT